MGVFPELAGRLAKAGKLSSDSALEQSAAEIGIGVLPKQELEKLDRLNKRWEREMHIYFDKFPELCQYESQKQIYKDYVVFDNLRPILGL